MKLPRAIFIALIVHSVLPLLVRADASSNLKAVEDAFFEWNKQRSPQFSTSIEDNTYNDCVDDLSIGIFQTNLAAVQGFLNATLRVQRSQLSRHEQYNYDVLRDTLTTYVSNYDWRQFGTLNPINFLEAFYLDIETFVGMTPFKTAKDFENYISRLERFPTQIDQMMERMNKSIQLMTTYHLVSVQAVPGQIQKVLDVPAAESGFYKPFGAALDTLGLTQTQKEDLRSRGMDGMRSLYSALTKLKTFMVNIYFHHTRGTYGVGGLPAGGNYYRACLAWHLSINTPPAQVHQTGLNEVNRIQQLMHKIMRKQNFSGTVAQYYEMLKEEPRFHRNTSEQLLDFFKDLIFNRITPKLPKLFKNIPPNRIVVKPLSYDGPYGMYLNGAPDGSRPGTFFANLMRPTETNTFSLVSLTLHESVPGHHLQFVYENASSLPDFQKNINYDGYYKVPYHFPFYTAYTEGWALYAEFLGEEMGVYADDYELMGRYGDEIFRACRLVVDTGMHYFGWSRQKAVDYLRAHTLMPLAEIEIEVNRYLTWPGQACAYKIGELKIKELRQKATVALGAKFDIRDFHSLLLDNGPVPLGVMETIVDDYIADVTGQGSGGPSIFLPLLLCQVVVAMLIGMP